MTTMWRQFIWVFFPIPLISLILLSLSWPRSLERLGFNLVQKIFFLKIGTPSIKIYMIWLFVLLSLFVLINSVERLQKAGQATSCSFHNGRTLCENRDPLAIKSTTFRAQRNFWLAFFNMFMWLLIWKMYHLKKQVLRYKDQVEMLKFKLETKEAADEKKAVEESKMTEEEKNPAAKKDD